MRAALALLFLLAYPPSLHEIAIGDLWEPHEARLIAPGGRFLVEGAVAEAMP
jgi:hypothetical protein